MPYKLPPLIMNRIPKVPVDMPVTIRVVEGTADLNELPASGTTTPSKMPPKVIKSNKGKDPAEIPGGGHTHHEKHHKSKGSKEEKPRECDVM